nr:reverse transcriptase domain-containing protein [Tanacetum cinerariifolium]
MSTRSSTPLDNPELTIRRRCHTNLTLLNNSEMADEGNGDLPVPDLRTMEKLCQPSLNGRGGPIALIAIQETNFGLKNDMIQQMAKMFLGKYFSPSKVTKLRNEIINFCQRLDELLFEAWERYKLSIDRCPNHNMLPVTQIDTFYNGLTLRHRDTINAAAGGTFMKRRPKECYDLIKNMTAHHNDWDTSAQHSESSSSITSSSDTKITALKAKMAEINKNLMRVLQPPSAILKTYMLQEPIKANDAILKNMQTNMTSLTNSNLELKNMFGQFMKMNTALSSGLGTLLGNTITNLKEDLKGITTQSGIAYQGPTIPTTTSSSPVVELETEAAKDMVHPTNNRNLNFNISIADALILMPKFGPSIKSLLTNKDKLCELARTALNEHCSTVLLKKLPKKLGDLGKFLIPCDFPRMVECLALADLDASINLMPLFVWNKLSLPDLSPTCMNLELADRSISRPVGVAEDVYVKVGTFHFPADFVVVEFDANSRVPLILERSFLKTGRSLIDVFEGELTLHVGKEAITFNLDQTSRYSTNYNDMTKTALTSFAWLVKSIRRKFSVFSIDFFLEEVDAFLALEDDPPSPEVDQSYFSTKGDILLLDAFLNDDPSLPPPNQGNNLPEVRKELKICEAKIDKSLIDEPPEAELKDLPPHPEYAFLEGDDKLPVIIAKDLSVEEKTDLITVLKSHKRAIAWKLSDIKGIDPEFYTHKILMEEDFEPVVQHQRRVNPKIHDVIKNEVLKLLDAGLIYPISDSLWVSPVHCVPKKGGFTVVENKENDLILTRLVTGWRVCIDYLFENSFQACLSHLEKMLKRCEDTNLCLNKEKSHFMVKEGIFLGHKISKEGIEVDKAKVDVIAKLPLQQLLRRLCYWCSPGATSKKYFRTIHYASKTMTEAKSNYTTIEKEMLAVVYAFEKFRSYLIMKKSIVFTDHSALKYLFAKKDSKARLLRWVLLLQEFTFKVIDTKGAENLATDHLFRLENPHQNVLDPKEINESFSLETLNLVSTRGNSSTPWFADFANYHARNFVVKGMSSQQKNKFFKDVKHYFWDD